MNVDSAEEFTSVSLCTGYGGIELGLKRVIPNLRTICFVEREAFAVANLVAKIEKGFLDEAPIWSDVKTFPAKEFHNKVHLLTGGYPCQPFSSAGKRAGENDERHLWPDIKRIISAMRPVYCFFENVEGHITLGLSTVISDLGEMGYKMSWGIFSACECVTTTITIIEDPFTGEQWEVESCACPPHRRKRVFILAVRIDLRFGGGEHGGSSGNDGNGFSQNKQRVGGEIRCEVAGCCGEPRELGNTGSFRPCRDGEDGEENSGNENKDKSGVHEFAGAGALSHDESPQAWPARPGEEQYEWEPPRVIRRFKSEVGRGFDEFAARLVSTDSRADELRLLGNGVVPATAAKAWVVLMEKMNG